LQSLIAAGASGLVGGLTFWGSLVAFGKLQGIVPERQILFPLQQPLNALVAALALAGGVWLVISGGDPTQYLLLVAVASVLGILLVIPIGGADMPVVIALLNSYSGIAAAMTGFVLGSNLLIIGGSLVGASGIILTRIMCKAMNRSLANVMFGVLGPSASTPGADDIYAGRVKATSADEVAMLFEAARRVAIIPGYGMAVAQAQYAVRDLSNMLVAKGIEVDFAIHPVAGRMPGHMNVLLAEAGIPYEQLKEADEINPSMGEVDVAIVIGANDVVNPVARTDPTSPIAGMPILDADKSRTVVVIKRSLSPGFAGIPNPLFAADNCLMLFADAKKAVTDMSSSLRELWGDVKVAAD
jgi:H+-translocating NAD(P) transhydrogenase subunit beta